MRRETGQSREPAPPDKIMGMILVTAKQIPGEMGSEMWEEG